jgi:peptidyl-prolyl cis-trans isomerase C
MRIARLYATVFPSALLCCLCLSCSPGTGEVPTVETSPTHAAGTTAPGIATSTPIASQQPALTATTPPMAPTPTVEAAAVVNGQPIPLAEYEAEVAQAMAVIGQQQTLDPSTIEGQVALQQLRRQILDAMIDQVIIEQVAAEQGIVITRTQVEDAMATLVGESLEQFENWLTANNLTRDTFQAQLTRQLLSAAVQEHVLGAGSPVVAQVRARHVLVATENEAIGLLLRLQSGESLADLAQTYSLDDSSSKRAGDLGFFPRGVMPPALEAAAFALEAGQISGVIKTDFGFHIVQVVEKEAAREVPEEMLATWRQNTFTNWLQAHRAVAKITYLIPLQ